MNVFKTKKFVLTTLILVLLSTLSFIVLQVFHNKSIQTINTYAFTLEGENDVDFESVATVSMSSNGYWKKTADGEYEASVPYTKRSFIVTWYETKTSTLTIKLNLAEESKINLALSHTSGELSTSPSIPLSESTTIILPAGEQTLTFTCSSTDKPQEGKAKVKIIDITPNKAGLDDNITEGRGTEAEPYLIRSKAALGSIKEAAGAVFSLETDIVFEEGETFTPICDGGSFAGVFYGNNHIIENLNIVGDKDLGLFAGASGATIENLILKNVNISGTSNIGSIAGNATNGSIIKNIVVENTNISGNGSCIGGFVGKSDAKTGFTVTNCSVTGTVTNINKGGNTGGFAGVGGTFNNCITYVDVFGMVTVGGFVGGTGVDSQFVDCKMAGSVNLIGEHSNNYPYMGLFNGYGAWNYFEASASGQLVTADFNSSQAISRIQIFNSNETPNGIEVAIPTPDSENNYTFTEFVKLSKTYVGSQTNASELTSEINYTGITGNYGGFTIRFTMADGKYKYISTCDRENARLISNLNFDLDELTSYSDNFSNLTILPNKGTMSVAYEMNSDIPYGGTVQISSAEDFEHLSWVVNGGISTTFITDGKSYPYNGRSIATLSVDLQADIDLSNSTQFYGFGNSEMMPYRGSIFGNGHTITLNMDYENAYLMGIINCATDTSNYVTISDLTVRGKIAGKYRVGIVAMTDHHNRGTKLKMVNVINYANVTGLSQVGAFLGNGQGAKSLINSSSSNTFEGCVNYGRISATQTGNSLGDAGGLIGSLGRNAEEGSYKIKNCANYGSVSATGNAGGFIGWSRVAVTFEGENISAGPVTTKYNFFIVDTAKISVSNGAIMKTIYTLNIGKKGVNLSVKATNASGDISFVQSSVTTNDEGKAQIEMLNVYSFSGVNLTVNVIRESGIEILKENRAVSLNNATMVTNLVLPIDIQLKPDDENVYSTTNSDDSWEVEAVVTKSDNTTETIILSILLDESALQTNQLVFANVKFDHATYNVSDFSKYLYRITADVESYVVKACELLNKTSGSTQEFSSLGADVKSKYETLLEEITTYGTENESHFKSYISSISNICNTNVSNDVLSAYYAKIATIDGIDDSAIKAVTNLNYGVYSFTEKIKITMLNGDESEKELTYSFAKTNISNDLKVTATTSGVSFKVGDVETCKYNESVLLTINKIDILGVAIENKNFVFDNTEKSTTATLTLLDGDSLNYTLKYTQNSLPATVKNVGIYGVELASISGDDAKFYNIPTDYEKGQIEIEAIKYALTPNAIAEFEYDTNAHVRSFDLAKQNSTTFDANKENDCVVTYSNETDKLDEKPTTVGTYTVEVAFTSSNFVFVGTNSYTFKILPKQITSVNFDSNLTYNAKQHSFEFSFDDVYDTDKESLNVSHAIRDSVLGKDVLPINAGSYELEITSVDNANYYVKDLIVDFTIKQADISISLEDQTSIYGDPIALSQDAFKIASGEIFANKDGVKDILFTLATTATQESDVASYSINVTNKNQNYNITTNEAQYIITKREIKVDFGTLSYEYSATNLYQFIKPTITGYAFEELNDIKFKLFNKDDEETVEFTNAGSYKYKLVENETTKNYVFKDGLNEDAKEATYTINHKRISVSLKEKVVKNYNKEILKSDFVIAHDELAGSHKIEDIANFEFEVSLNGVDYDYQTTLDVETYVVKINYTQTELGTNYIIETKDGELQITEGSTYFETEFTSKFYDEQKVDFVAKLFDADNIEIVDANIDYSITKNNEKADEIREVGTYQITVSATAGSNYIVEPKTFEYVVNANIVTISISNLSQTYNGKAYTPNFVISMSKDVSLEGKLTYSIFDKLGELSTAKNADDYVLKFDISDKNYQLKTSEFNISIKPIEVQVKVKDREISFGDEFKIQSTEKEITGDVLEGESLDLVFSILNFESIVGDYVLTAENKNKNYHATINPATFKVKQRELKVDFLGNAELTYNPLGYPEILTAKVENALKNEDYSIYYQNANKHQIESVVDAGTYYIVVEIVDTHNYKFETAEEMTISKQFKINKLTLDLTIDISSKTYDSKCVEFNGVYVKEELFSQDLYSVEYFNGLELVSQPKDAGVYTIKINEKIEKNYQFVNNTKEFEIYHKELTLSEIKQTYAYTRLTIKPVLDLIGVVPDEDVKLDYEYLNNGKDFICAGDYSIKINGLKGAQISNYVLNAQEIINYSIEKISVAINIANNEFVFSNKQIKQEDLGIEFESAIKILQEDFALSELPINAGEHEITFICKNESLNFNTSKFNILIKKAEINEISLLDLSVNYDNNYHSLAVNKTTLTNGVKIDVEYSANNFVDAGSYEITAKLFNDNYIDKILTATLKINQISIKVGVSEQNSFTYNGNAQGIEILNLSSLWYNQLISYNYVGNNYSSISKPTNSGEYILEIKANNENNINIENKTNNFAINTKGITIKSLAKQTTTYSAQVQEFAVSTAGVLEKDVVLVELSYNDEKVIPINAGNYEIKFVGVFGKDAHNYHIINKDAVAEFEILPYTVNVKAENKTSVYGEEELPLTYVADALLGNDKYSGNVEREFSNVKRVNSYSINQGTLSAGNNYQIMFEKGVYVITHRALNYVEFIKEFTYNGESQIPSVEFTNLAQGDENVAMARPVYGSDTVNAGTYELEFVINNSNYILPETSTFEIKINKLNQTEKIICLLTTEKDYDELPFEPWPLIDDELNCVLEYSFASEPVKQMIDAGTYSVKVKIDEQNFYGEKTFDFTIHKIDHSEKVLNALNVEISSNQFKILGLEGISVSVDNVNFNLNSVQNLNSKTAYDVYVIIPEDKNHKATKFMLGNYITCASANEINQQIEEIINEKLNFEDVNDLKQLLKDCEELTSTEQEILNNEKYQEIIDKYNEYFESVEQDVVEVNVVSSIVDFGVSGRVRKITTMISVLGVGMLFVKGKKKDEFKN